MIVYLILESMSTANVTTANPSTSSSSAPIYLDCNATTMMSAETKQEWLRWTNRGNPSAEYKSALNCRKVINDFKLYIAKQCGFKLDEGDDPMKDPKAYRVIFTSCATESNNTIIRSVVDAYRSRDILPHIILSAVEHKSSIECATHLEALGDVQLTLVEPDRLGFITAASIEHAIRENTCLISIMHANNETGTINDIAAIGTIAHKHNVPFHTDAVQTFGKYPLQPLQCNVDAFSISFHKIYGPPGVGALVLKSEFIGGYKLCACIAGSQNHGLRGGTENTPGIAASYYALRETYNNRTNKNSALTLNKRVLINELSERLPCRFYSDYLREPAKHLLEVIILSPNSKLYLPNTLLLSIVKHRDSPPRVCNGEIKRAMEKAGFIISVGSACNTSSKLASHILSAMKADDKIKRGTLRISFCDSTKKEELIDFAKAFAAVINNYNR